MDATRYSNQRVRAAFVQLFKAAARALDLAGMISARTKTAPCCRQASETRSEANGDTARSRVRLPLIERRISQ